MKHTAAAFDAPWVCEQHPDRQAFHDNCPGPGMPADAYTYELTGYTTSPTTTHARLTNLTDDN